MRVEVADAWAASVGGRIGTRACDSAVGLRGGAREHAGIHRGGRHEDHSQGRLRNDRHDTGLGTTVGASVGGALVRAPCDAETEGLDLVSGFKGGGASFAIATGGVLPHRVGGGRTEGGDREREEGEVCDAHVYEMEEDQR